MQEANERKNIMLLKEKIEAEQRTAMKLKLRATSDEERTQASERLNALRSISAAVTAAETSGKQRTSLDDAQTQQVLQRVVKQRRDAAEIYRSAGEEVRAKGELQEAAVAQEFLPQQLDENELQKLISSIVSENKLSGNSGLGIVMKQLKSRGDVDKSQASKIAREILTN